MANQCHFSFSHRDLRELQEIQIKLAVMVNERGRQISNIGKPLIYRGTYTLRAETGTLKWGWGGGGSSHTCVNYVTSPSIENHL